MTTNSVLSYVTEIILSILLIILLRLVGVKSSDILLPLINNIGTVLTAYGILIALSCGLVVIMLNENDHSFVKWLIKNRAEYLYRNAAIYTLSSFVFGAIIMCLIKLYVNNSVISNISAVILFVNLMQSFTMIILINNYLSLKRKWQELN